MNQAIWPLLIGAVLGLAAVFVGMFLASKRQNVAEAAAAELLVDAERDGANRVRELEVAAQEQALAVKEDVDRQERELDDRDTALDQRARTLDQNRSEQQRTHKKLDQKAAHLTQGEAALQAREEALKDVESKAQTTLERIAGLSVEEARAELIADIEGEAREEAARIARRIEEEGRQNAERSASNLIVQATQRVNINDVMESTVSFIQLPNDEMKGRIIGKEGRNIRALEMATGIDLIVDDTPRSIWISSFDPVRREVARVSVDRLLEDGRIHPARIEEVVEQVQGEIESLIEERGNEAAFSLGISDLHPKLAQLVGRMRYHTTHGQNLLQHALETAMIAAFMCQELGASGEAEIVHRAGLLHEIGQVVPDSTNHSILASAELCEKHRETAEVAEAIRSLHPDVQPTNVGALLLNTANRLSETRPGARKDNLAVFIERLRRLEAIATAFPGVERAYAVKAGKELRVIIDATKTRDDNAYKLSKDIARTIEREISFPGQIKVAVVRQTRSVRYAL